MQILIVEDDKALNENIREALLAEHCRVDSAFDGFIGERLLRKNHYDCVLLDVNLPHKNGYEICRLFRQHDTSTPVLLLTAFDELEDKIQGFDSGADDYLTKPFYMQELLLRIHALVKRSRQHPLRPSDEKIILEDIVINLQNKSVRKRDQEIPLTPREYQILLKLAAAKGELVSKQELIKEIWGSAFDANTNTVEVYINFLRNKIDKPFGSHMIRTRVGYGYYLELPPLKQGT